MRRNRRRMRGDWSSLRGRRLPVRGRLSMRNRLGLRGLGGLRRLRRLWLRLLFVVGSLPLVLELTTLQLV
jgi:hypothetical protein